MPGLTGRTAGWDDPGRIFVAEKQVRATATQPAPFPRRPFPDGPRRTFPWNRIGWALETTFSRAGGPAADQCRISRLDDSILSGQRERHEPMTSQDHDHPAADAVAGDSLSFDTSVAHPARIYNYWLGGKDNYEADRQAAEQAIAVTPDILPGVRANRAFLRRAVEFVAGQGIRQFLDIGTGLPTADNTHEVAQDIAPESRVVYVDNDPIVLAHARALLTSTPEGATAYVAADARDTAKIIESAAALLDFTQPVAVMALDRKSVV